MEQTQNELATGKVGKLLFKLAIPAIVAQIINLLYNIVDRMYIGHIAEIGDLALTGVGVTFAIIILVSAFAALIGMGGAPRAAIKLGENDKDGAEEILGNAFTALTILAVILTIVFLAFKEPILYAFGASENTFKYANSYITIYLLGTLFVQYAMGLNVFISSQGFAKTSMMSVLIGAITNIVLDPILIFGFNMGVQGAAIATVISQAMSAIWIIHFLASKKSGIRLQKKHMHLRKDVLMPMIALGVAPFIMQATEAAISVSFNSSLYKYGGDTAVGAMTIMSSLMQFIMLPSHGLTQGAQPIISYNFGAKNMKRVKETYFWLLGSCLLYTILFTSCIMLFPQGFISVFNNKPALMDTAVWASRIYFAGMFVFGAQIACQQTLLAVGQAKISVFLACLRKIILLIPLIYILPSFMENKVLGVFLAEPIADILAVIVTICVFAYNFPKILQNRECEM